MLPLWRLLGRIFAPCEPSEGAAPGFDTPDDIRDTPTDSIWRRRLGPSRAGGERRDDRTEPRDYSDDELMEALKACQGCFFDRGACTHPEGADLDRNAGETPRCWHHYDAIERMARIAHWRWRIAEIVNKGRW